MSSQKSSKKVTKKKSTIKKGGGGKSISSKKSEKNLSKKLKKLSKKSTAPKSESSQSSTKLDDSKTIAKSCTNVSTDDTLKKTAKSDSIKKSNNVDADLTKQQDAAIKVNTTQPLSTPNNGIPLDVNEKCLFNTCKLDPDIALKVSKNRQAIEQVIQLLRDIPPDQITGDIKEDLIRIHLIARGIRIRLAHHLAEQERKMMDTMMKMLTPPPGSVKKESKTQPESEGQNTMAKTNEINDNSKFKTGKFDDSSISAAKEATDMNKSMKSDQQQSTTTTDNTLGKMIENEIVKIIAEPLAKAVEDNDENCKIIIKAVVKEEVTAAAAATVKTDDADTFEAKNGDDNASSNSSQNQTTNEDD